jgi:hypothetical protein
MARGRKKKEEIQTLEGHLRDINLVQKSKPLFSLWGSDLTLSEFKILDTYLSRIDSHKPEKRNVVFSKGELENLLGVKKVNQSVLDERLKHLMGYVVRVDNPRKRKGYAFISLFEKAYCEKDEYGLWTVELECTQSAMEYFFNIEELGYLRYKIRSVTALRSLYSYIMFTYLEYNRFRKSWTVSLDELKNTLNCTSETYTEYKRFNDLVLKKCYRELTEKTNLRYTYEAVGKDNKPVKRGCKAYGIRFTLETLSDNILANTSTPNMELEGQVTFDELPAQQVDNDEHWVEVYGSERLAILAEGCDYEFNKEEMEKIFAVLLRINVPKDHVTNDLTYGRQFYLREKYTELNAEVAKKAEKGEKPIKNRFKYYLKMLEQDAFQPAAYNN